jgi:uncharacterized protein
MELCLVIDHACNLRCSYCYTGQKAPRPMPQQVAEKAIDFALRRDPTGLVLSFFGGEPLLHLDLMQSATTYARQQLGKACSSAGLQLHLNTNATLVDDRVAAFVRESLPLTAFVSLDGPAAVHDRHRSNAVGRGSHAEVREGIERLHAAGANVVVLGVINPDTARALGSIAEEFLGLPVARAHVVCNLRATWDDQAIEDLRMGLHDAALRWKDAFCAGKIYHFEPFTTKILSHLHAAMPCASRCQFAVEELVVAPSGRLYTCGELVGEDTDDRCVIGTLDTGLDEPKLAVMREARNRVESICESCPIHERCSSSCGCKHVALTGELGRITETLCNTEAAFIEAADHVAEELHQQSNSAFLDFFYRRQWAPTAAPLFVKLRRKDVGGVV